jgi:hypothetical protein
MEELFWLEKSRVKWHIDGDRNTKYFHRLAKIKNSTKLINVSRDGDNVITDPTEIANIIVNHFQNIFTTNNVLQDNNLIDDVIPHLVDDQINIMLTSIPTPEEIKNAVFSLSKDSAPGPDGCGGFFYQTYWEIIHNDVCNAIMDFFRTGFLLPNWNANSIVLIPKTQNADTVDQFRPTALANFKFKIISKILADRLGTIMPSLVSPEQRGFIHGRQMKDCICTTSEAINLLNKKSYGGNLALKIDISKAFDTLDWVFLLQVLQAFGFNATFCSWINSILNSARLSISINGSHEGYFKCSRGVRQGDPLSPLLFCLAEDVLSRGITKGKLDLIKGTRFVNVPSHTLC